MKLSKRIKTDNKLTTEIIVSGPEDGIQVIPQGTKQKEKNKMWQSQRKIPRN